MNSVDISQVATIVADDATAMAQLEAVRGLALPDGWIAAGFVRNRVWDCLSGIWPPRPVDDVDVVYFDATDPEGAREADHEAMLSQRLPGVPWQVRNQARMHHRKGDAPYRDTAHSMLHWLETATAIGVRLDLSGRIEVLAPYGVEDLLGLVCRPTEAGRRWAAEYRARVEGKAWQARWPKLLIIEPDATKAT
jgi:hypothetical protein